MKTWLTMLCACLALGLVVAGCGGDDDEESSGAATTQEQPAETTEDERAASVAKKVSVSMKDIQFDPGDVAVAKGGTVTWTNDDSVGHDVTKKDGPGPDFKSGDPGAMNGGDTYKATFDIAGEINYVCTVHPGMDGTITVE